MKNILKTLAIAITFFMIGCGDDDNTATAPQAPALIFPLNNSECETGISLSETESKITLEWNASPNADAYFVYIKNLNTQATLQYSLENVTSFETTFLKATPYSWYVTAKSNASGMFSKSEVWKFYNSGEGIENYIPFPAELVAPEMSNLVVGPTIDLVWNGDDVDDDIENFKVYFGTEINPTNLISTTEQQRINEVPVASNTNYYWKVVTTDSVGNVSTSPIFQFRTY